MDERLMPYAHFMEEFAQQLVEYQPQKVCVCAILPSGEVLTGYMGDTGPQDKAVMAYNINCDAIMDTVCANAKTIIQAAEEQEEEE